MIRLLGSQDILDAYYAQMRKRIHGGNAGEVLNDASAGEFDKNARNRKITASEPELF